MKAVIQRVASAAVEVEGATVGSIGKGLLILLGVVSGDTENEAVVLADKISRMRIFEDDGGKMNLSANDIEGEVLVVSNFTLCASCRRGNRPDFTAAEKPERANELYRCFLSLMKERTASGVVEAGVFGADMKLLISGDGPVTIVLDSDALKK